MTASSAPDSPETPPAPSAQLGDPGHEAAELAALLRAAGCGDEASFGTLYDATATRAYGLAVRVLDDPARAERVTQQAFVEIWRQSARFDPSWGSPMAWILSIVHRGAVDEVRAVEEPTSGGPADVNALTTLEQASLELAYFGGRTHTEVAGFLQLSPGTAAARIRQALSRLRGSLEPH